jgi:hypothetical protein
MNAFDELQRQLIESVAARSRVGRPAAVASVARWWRGRIGRAATITTISLLLVLVLAAAQLLMPAGDGSPHSQAASSLTASLFEGACGPCRTFAGQLHGPPAEDEAEAASNPAGAAPARATVHGHDRRGPSVVSWAHSEDDALLLPAPRGTAG